MNGNHLVPGQPLQAGAVGLPLSVAGSWVAVAAVELYSLGAGVHVAGLSGHLFGGQRTLELEDGGVGFIFNPLSAHHAQGLVLTVDGDVAAILESYQAVDQEGVAEPSCSECGHSASPQKTAILSLPSGTGKTTMAPALAQWLGCTGIVDEWRPGLPLVAGALHLTACKPAQCLSTPAKQPPTIPATCSTADLLGELHARQDECMDSILWATPQALHNKVCDEIAALLAWTQVVSNIHWRAIGVPNGPMLTSEPSTAAAASTAFNAHAQKAPAQPVQPLKLPESTAEIVWNDSDVDDYWPTSRMAVDIFTDNSTTHIQQSLYQPNEGWNAHKTTSPHLHIGWHGTQTVIDEAGREWTRTFGPCVIDNFGSLADCYTGEPA